MAAEARCAGCRCSERVSRGPPPRAGSSPCYCSRCSCSRARSRRRFFRRRRTAPYAPGPFPYRRARQGACLQHRLHGQRSPLSARVARVMRIPEPRCAGAIAQAACATPAAAAAAAAAACTLRLALPSARLLCVLACAACPRRRLKAFGRGCFHGDAAAMRSRRVQQQGAEGRRQCIAHAGARMK